MWTIAASNKRLSILNAEQLLIVSWNGGEGGIRTHVPGY